jgi:hypothetical protein
VTWFVLSRSYSENAAAHENGIIKVVHQHSVCYFCRSAFYFALRVFIAHFSSAFA